MRISLACGATARAGLQLGKPGDELFNRHARYANQFAECSGSKLAVIGN
jgi:hypothetical protein